MWPCRCGKRCRGSELYPSACGSSAAAPPAPCTVWLSAPVSLLSSSPRGSLAHRPRHLHHPRPHPHRLTGPALWEPAGTEDSSRTTLRKKHTDVWNDLQVGPECVCVQIWSHRHTVVSAAATSRAPRYPESFMLTDGPGSRGDRRGQRGRCVSLHKSVGIHTAELHDVKQAAEVLSTDPDREDDLHQRSYCVWEAVLGSNLSTVL